MIVLAGETLCLLGQRAVWWAARRTLLIADLHLGKEATFRASGMPVPDQTERLLRRLSGLIHAYSPDKLLILGDLIHARRGRCRITFQLISDWRRLFPELTIELIRGNHDRAAGDPPSEWQMICCTEPQWANPFSLRHEPAEDLSLPGMAGHLHPTVRLSGRGGDSLKLPCFLIRRQSLILPAFSEFVDGAVQKLMEGDRVFAICDHLVHEFGTS
ncbi:MAG: ligase-associated DNA damage response endonuclease PdeM [Planctomycetota bacterium]